MSEPSGGISGCGQLQCAGSGPAGAGPGPAGTGAVRRRVSPWPVRPQLGRDRDRGDDAVSTD